MSTAKLTVHPATAPTPTEAVVAAAKKFVTVTDSLGRSLKVKRLSGLDKLDLAKIVGPEGCANPAVMGPSVMAFSVKELDGEAILPPNSWAELRLLVGRLDDEGLQAVEDAYIANWGTVETPAQAEEALKNG